LNRETAAILGEARTAGPKNNDLALKAIAREEKQLDFERRLLAGSEIRSMSADPRRPELRGRFAG
jgi:hypothetical protein